jgi:hypothetical protein
MKPVFGSEEYFSQCYPAQLVRDLYSVWLWTFPTDKTDEDAFWAWATN